VIPAGFSPDDCYREIQEELSTPRFAGVPLGPTLSDALVAGLYNSPEQWVGGFALSDVLRRWRYRIRPYRGAAPPLIPQPRIFVTWSTVGVRNRALMMPVIQQLGPQTSYVIACEAAMLSGLPPGFQGTGWREAMYYDVAAWRAELAPLWPALRGKLLRLAARYRLSAKLRRHLLLNLLLSSQYVCGCLELLERARPAAIVVDYDRHRLWSALILAARRQGIPTFTLVHGVVGDQALGYAPFLADQAFCWGEIDRGRLLAAGVEPSRLLITGCPRLTTTLSATREQSLAKLGWGGAERVVLLATAPFPRPQRLQLAELFCSTVEALSGVVGVVRLHASEQLDAYRPVVRRHPAVRFLPNGAWTVDEAIAAADVVVVHSSGFGSDALTKGRPVIVLDAIDVPLGHGADLHRLAHCPKPCSSGELAAAIRSLVFDEAARRQALEAAARFARMFCAAAGQQAAANIVRAVLAGAVPDGCSVPSPSGRGLG
jgi:hypothetical protein